MLSWTQPRRGVLPPASGAEPRLRPADRFALIALAILVLTALNLTYRLNRETITEWDESLYATTAWEMLQSGDWISTTFHGEIDYYNAKPPLNVWLIALAFKVFGVSAASLRLASVVCAWLTVALLMWWTRRIFGDMHALLAGLVLATCFGFIYVHSARTANTDALFTLLMLLVVITLDASERNPWRRVWLGPILAAVFLLRGTAILMPLVLIAAVATRPARPRGPHSWLPSVCATLAFAAPALAWGVARWRVDQWRFFDKLWSYDLIARTATALEGHGGTPLFYLNVLQKYQYDWLVAAAVAIALRPSSMSTVINGLSFWRSTRLHHVLIGWWAVVTLLIPTVLMTKVPWYLNPFYPVFAIAVAGAMAHVCRADGTAPRWRRTVMIAVVVAASGIAEGRLLWHSLRNRDIRGSVQELLHAERSALAGQTVYRERWTHADRFVLTAMVGGSPALARDAEAFLIESAPGDYLLAAAGLHDPRLVSVRSLERHGLYRKE